jgi:hypothetical protein
MGGGERALMQQPGYHRFKHPQPVDGCFACHVGVGEPRGRRLPDLTVADMARTFSWDVHDDVRMDGRVAGVQTEHKSGRLDALVYAPPPPYQPQFQEA